MGRIARRIAALPPHRWLRALAEAKDELEAAIPAVARPGARRPREPEADDDLGANGASTPDRDAALGRGPTAESEPAAGGEPSVGAGKEVPRSGHSPEAPEPTPPPTPPPTPDESAAPAGPEPSALSQTDGATPRQDREGAEAADGPLRRSSGATGDTRTLAGREFRRVAVIRPEADANGLPVEEMPHLQYDNRAGLPLNRHGYGPFCRFSVWGLPPRPGVYAVTVAGGLVYVGIANDLRERWGARGYGRIHPRNCFRGGQSTNCKVNHAILTAARGGREIQLWIHETLSLRPVEQRLISRFEPPWNDRA